MLIIKNDKDIHMVICVIGFDGTIKDWYLKILIRIQV